MKRGNKIKSTVNDLDNGVHMVYTCTAEIKEYDIKAHVYSMVALW